MQDRQPTWKEWLAVAVFVPPLFIAGLVAFGMFIEGVSFTSEQRDKCLKQAVTGYEIKQCK